MSRNTLRIQFDTQENVSSEAMKRLFELIDKIGWMTVNVSQIEIIDIIDLPELKNNDESKKSKAQIMRAVLFRLWEKDSENIKDFELYYSVKMDRFINSLKERLN